MDTKTNGNAIDTSDKLGDIVTNNPSLAIEFEKRGLDYCCQGARTLSDAAKEDGIEPQTLADELTTAMIDEEPSDWATLSPVDLVDNINDVHHKYLWDNFDRVSALVEKIADVHGSRHPELIEAKRLYEEIRADLAPHLEKEEEILFPLIKKTAQSGDENVDEVIMTQISTLSDEHETVGELLAQLKTITNSYLTPADGCATYAATYQALADMEIDIHTHIHKESNVLFPALKTLAPKQWSESLN